MSENILKDIDGLIMPGITHWQSPKFFGYFPTNTSGPSILADLISSGLGVNGMLWENSQDCFSTSLPARSTNQGSQAFFV